MRVCQKLIRRNEQRPTPSQPKNNTVKLPAATRSSMKNVNALKYAIKRLRCGSVYIYTEE